MLEGGWEEGGSFEEGYVGSEKSVRVLVGRFNGTD